jgi:hypothetical protein
MNPVLSSKSRLLGAVILGIALGYATAHVINKVGVLESIILLLGARIINPFIVCSVAQRGFIFVACVPTLSTVLSNWALLYQSMHQDSGIDLGTFVQQHTIEPAMLFLAWAWFIPDFFIAMLFYWINARKLKSDVVE